jgi:hypothetical protein
MTHLNELVNECYDVVNRYQSYEVENDHLSLDQFEHLIQRADTLLPELDTAINQWGGETHGSK